jgi:hypothetical protein
MVPISPENCAERKTDHVDRNTIYGQTDLLHMLCAKHTTINHTMGKYYYSVLIFFS